MKENETKEKAGKNENKEKGGTVVNETTTFAALQTGLYAASFDWHHQNVVLGYLLE